MGWISTDKAIYADMIKQIVIFLMTEGLASVKSFITCSSHLSSLALPAAHATLSDTLARQQTTLREGSVKL
jgi:hypothetical protein